MDSNHRRHSRRIYSPLHLAALQPTHKFKAPSLGAYLELVKGIEPSTCWLQVSCSTIEPRQHNLKQILKCLLEISYSPESCDKIANEVKRVRLSFSRLLKQKSYLSPHKIDNVMRFSLVREGKKSNSKAKFFAQGAKISPQVQIFAGAQRWNRTTDTGIFSPLLYRLSYLGKRSQSKLATACFVFFQNTPFFILLLTLFTKWQAFCECPYGQV